MQGFFRCGEGVSDFQDVYTGMLHKLSSRLIWLRRLVGRMKGLLLVSSKELRAMHAKERTTKHETIQAASASVAWRP